ncbi:MAG: KEOPS complex subunit Cgi121 [Candidatus Methanomethylophilaceae archaeon]
MVSNLRIVGIRGKCPVKEIVGHFNSMGSDVILMDPSYVYCEEQIFSAVEHAERAFRSGNNRSKTLLTEIIMYTAGERQISKALTKMKPKKDQESYVAVIIDAPEDLRLGDISVERCDEIIAGNPEKSRMMGLDNALNIPCEDLALEMVAMLDLAK